MNKKLLFAAVGAALSAAPMVVVHADTTLYGHLHESFDNIDNAQSKNGYTSSNSSRFGIKGNEDLGDGLKAIYQVESGVFGMTDGNGTNGSTTSGVGLSAQLRNSYLGFAGSWGAVKVGRYDSPFKELGRALDNFNEEVGDLRNISSTDAATIYDARISNMIRYESPEMAGFNVNFLHSSSNGLQGVQGPGAAGGNSVNSLGANWTGGPFKVLFAYQRDGYQQSGTGATAVDHQHDGAWRLAAAYTYEGMMVGLAHQDLKDALGMDLNEKANILVASYNVSNNLIKFQYAKADSWSGSACGKYCAGGSLWALGLDHSLSKSTLVYVNYAEAKDDANSYLHYSVVSAAAGGHGYDDPIYDPNHAGAKSKGISAGMILNF